MIKNKYRDFPIFFSYFYHFLLIFFFFLGFYLEHQFLFLFVLPIFPLLFFIQHLYFSSSNAVLYSALQIFGFLYLSLGFVAWLFFPFLAEKNTFFYLLFIYISIWMNDSFAYLVGRKIGKTKLFERISPNKTWEGTLGGIFFSTLFLSIFAYFYEANFSFWLILINILICILATLGDLIESNLKRFTQVKDSSQFLPGHGGFLDRLDSLLLVIPFATWCLLLIKKYL